MLFPPKTETIETFVQLFSALLLIMNNMQLRVIIAHAYIVCFIRTLKMFTPVCPLHPPPSLSLACSRLTRPPIDSVSLRFPQHNSHQCPAHWA